MVNCGSLATVRAVGLTLSSRGRYRATHRLTSRVNGRALGLQAVIAGAATSLLWLTGHRTIAVIAAGIAATTITASLASPVAARWIAAGIGWLTRAVGTVLTVVLLGVVYLVVFTPIGLWQRVTGRDVIRRLSDPAKPSYWEPVVPAPAALHTRTFTLEGQLTRPGGGAAPRWLVAVRLCSLVVFVMALNYVAGWAMVRAGIWQHQDDRIFEQPSWIRAADWRDAYREEWRAAEFHYRPIIGWERRAASGKHINSKDGVRATYQPASPRPVTVAFFGGSTMFGSAARDDHTIPSQFSRLAEARGVPVHVENRGELGYSAWQEVSLFTWLASSGRLPPGSVAVFYDGYNDVASQMTRPAVELRDALRTARERYEEPWNVQRFADHYSAVRIALNKLTQQDVPNGVRQRCASPADTARASAKVHHAAADVAFRLGDSYGIHVVWFFQPVLFTKKTLAADEAALLRRYDPRCVEAYRAARAEWDRRVVDVTDALDGIDQSVYWDAVHLTEDGNRIVAERLTRELDPLLRELAR